MPGVRRMSDPGPHGPPREYYVICREIDGLRSSSRKLQSSLLPYGSAPSSFSQSAFSSRWISFRMETFLLGASKLLIQDSHRINFPFSSIFTCSCSSVEFHVLITFLYSRPSVCWVSGECRIKDECPQREYYVR